MARARPLSPVPLALRLQAAGRGIADRLADEWRGGALAEAALARPRATGLAARPRDVRPPDVELGRAAAEGRFPLAGALLESGAGGDPWDRPSPSRQLAVQLHRFVWLPALLELGPSGAAESLRLTLAWRALFDRPAPFAWSAEVMERRVFNLACGLAEISAPASDHEADALAQSLARQARALLRRDPGPARRAERLAAAAVAGCALAGAAGERLLARALPALARALEAAVLPDGGLRTRSPEQGLELGCDLATLDDALLQRGREAPDALSRARDRLDGALRFFTLPDGALASFNGGGPSAPARVRAAGREPAGGATGGRASPYAAAPHAGYHRLDGARLSVMVDAGAPPEDGWSDAACAQPLAFEAVAGGERLIANAGWTPDAAAPLALRLAAAGSTVALDDASPGRPLTGFLARRLGARLVGGATEVSARRRSGEAGVLLELSHNGWTGRFGLLHGRRLHLDPDADELRGEDRLSPAPGATPPPVKAAARFHLPPGVRASLARDGRSVLLRGPSDRGWWFRNDAPSVTLEDSVCVEADRPRRAAQIVLRAPSGPGGARIRWKLSPVDPPGAAPPKPPSRERAP